MEITAAGTAPESHGIPLTANETKVKKIAGKVSVEVNNIATFFVP